MAGLVFLLRLDTMLITHRLFHSRHEKLGGTLLDTQWPMRPVSRHQRDAKIKMLPLNALLASCSYLHIQQLLYAFGMKGH